MKRAATLVLVTLAMSASAAVDARALAHEGQKTQWAPTRIFSSLNARAVFGGESRGATSPYAGEEWETAACEKDWQYAAGNPTRFVDSDGRDPAEISAREYSTIDFWSRAQIGPYAPFVDLSSGEARTPTADYRRGLSYPRDYEADPVNPLPVYDNRRVLDRALFNTPVRLVQGVASLPLMLPMLGSPEGMARLPEFQRGMDSMFSPLKVGYGANADPEAIASAELFWDVQTTLPFVVAPLIGAPRAAPAIAGRLAPSVADGLLAESRVGLSGSEMLFMKKPPTAMIGAADEAFLQLSTRKQVDAAFGEIAQAFGDDYAKQVRTLFDETNQTFTSSADDLGVFYAKPLGTPSTIVLNNRLGNCRLLANTILHEVRHYRHFKKFLSAGGSIKEWRALDTAAKERFATSTNIWQGRRLGLDSDDLDLFRTYYEFYRGGPAP